MVRVPPRRTSPQQQARQQQAQARRQQAQAQQRTRKQVRTVTSAANTVQRETGGGHFAPYQSIILAEFVLAELLVAATPIATRKNQPGLSPYVPRDMTKLLSLGLVFFLLELGATTGPGAGRFGAWFGGLLLLVVGLGEAASITKVLDIFGGHTKSAQSLGESPPSGPSGGVFT